MYKRLKSFLLLAMILTSSAIGVISTPQNASAATANLYLAPAAKKDAEASAYRFMLALCTERGDLHSSLGEATSASNIAKGDWFAQEKSQPEGRVGYLVDKENGQVQCRNLFKGHNPAKTLGWNSNIELACGIGYTRTNESNCVNGSGSITKNSTNKNEIYSKIDAKYTNATGGNGYNNRQYYVMAANTLLVACKWKPVVNLSDATPDQKNSDDLERIKVVTGTGKVVEVLYKRDDNGKKAFRNDENDFHYITENCDWMKDRMNEYADTYANWVKDNQPEEGDNAGPGVDTGDDDAEDEGEAATTCAVSGVGWIVCPVANFLALIADGAYAGVEALLVVEPLSTNTSSATYTAWSVMRDFANVAFIIVFLVIVFSQLTSIGVSNYGIKKLLPKLIFAAVLVNVSYWLCAIAIDLSNIAGSSMKSVLEAAAASVPSDSQGIEFLNGDSAFGQITGAVLAGAATAALLYAAVGTLLPVLISAAFAIAIVFIILSARQALLVLWVVIAPLAFVAFLLPNTESWFKKWWALGKGLLLIYLAVAFLFGASSLASDIILKSSSGFDITEISTAELQELLIIIMAVGLKTIPLFLLPAAIQALIKLSGGFLGKFAGIVNNPNKGPVDRARKRAEAMGKRIEDRRQIGALSGKRRLLGGKYRRNARREAINTGIASEAKRGETSYIASTSRSDEISRTQSALSALTRGRAGGKTEGELLRNQLGGGVNVPGTDRFSASDSATNRALASAISVQAELEAKEVKAAQAVINELNLSSSQLNNLAQGGSVTKNGQTLTGSNNEIRSAAIQSAVKTGTVGDVEGIITTASTMNDSQRKILSEAIAQSGIASKATHLGGQTIDDIAQGNVKTQEDLDRVMVRAINSGKYSADKLAENDKDSLKRMAGLITSGRPDLNTGSVTELRQKAADVDATDRLKTKVQASSQPYMDQIRGTTPPSPPPGPGSP